jgi:membrane protein implicated in regulation of membrane protease activity
MFGPLEGGLFGPETLPLLLIVAGLGLSIAEAMAPGAHFIVVGTALLGAGLVGFLLGPTLPILASPLILGLLVLAFGAGAFYAYHEVSPFGGTSQGRTSDSASLKGGTGRVTQRVTGTEGEVKLDAGGFNPYYSARSMEGTIEEGTEVMVVDPGGGNVLTVAPVGAVEDDIDRELAKGRRESEGGKTTRTGEAAADREGEPDAEGESERETERK